MYRVEKVLRKKKVKSKKMVSSNSLSMIVSTTMDS